MYIETSSPRKLGDNAKLNSPLLSFSEYMCLKFFYHMYGATIGKLNVMIDGSRVFSASGNKGNKWIEARITTYRVGNARVRKQWLVKPFIFYTFLKTFFIPESV